MGVVSSVLGQYPEDEDVAMNQEDLETFSFLFETKEEVWDSACEAWIASVALFCL